MTRILLDECLPVKLQHRFLELDDSYRVATVTGKNWNGIKNGKLLELAQENFDIFITIDQNIPYQQTVSKFSIALIALQAKSNRYNDLLPFLEPTVKIIKNCKPGKSYTVSI
ncbi:DUF5615 family PIN-like protein [Natronogracilivirga saccharolytica]|uniref:DUF5615 family PIN-like protein n=1 Tax=Natronogracilivirga saccharolytica TaxID=2812953 RepID=A0A8J7S9U1_9BACT|nr:DUF5615 family PIN-like protein [Natronogracilivirga saccharolytica]MBP3193058.1 DUF5615 family PIN-like protein [Natronogracilivirga saccharolytica]